MQQKNSEIGLSATTCSAVGLIGIVGSYLLGRKNRQQAATVEDTSSKDNLSVNFN